MEAAPGFEPGNNGFADRRLSHLAMPPPWGCEYVPIKKRNGAGNGIRTRDIYLGKVELYH